MKNMDNSVKIIGLDFNLSVEGVMVGAEIDKTVCSAFGVNDDELKKLIKESVMGISSYINKQVAKVMYDVVDSMENGESMVDVCNELLSKTGIKVDVDLKEKEALARQIMNSLKREVRDKK